MSTTITRENFTAAMEQAVAERGEDWVYPDEWKSEYGTCLYVVHSPLGSRGAACLIGRAIEIVTGELVPDEFEEKGADTVLRDCYAVEDDQLRIAARYAQRTQDVFGTWGEALARFKGVLA